MYKKMQNVKIHTKLIISFIGVIILPLIVISFIVYTKSTDSIKQNAHKSANILSEQLTQGITVFVEDTDRMTKSILLDSDIIERVTNEKNQSMSQRIKNKIEVDQLLTRIITLRPKIDSIILITEQSLYYYNDKAEILDEEMLKGQEWLERVRLSKNNLIITDVHQRLYYGEAEKDVVFTVGRVLYKSNGTFAGLLLMDLKPTDLLELSQETLLSMRDYGLKLIVTNNKGGIVYHSDVLTENSYWDDYIGRNYLQEKILRDDNYLFSSNQIKTDILLVNIEVSKEKLYNNIKDIRYITLIAGILCISFVVIISIYISYRITKPIKVLQSSMNLLDGAKYEPIENFGTSNEIDDLIDCYNNMRRKIEKLVYEVYIAEIKQKEAQISALQTQINPHVLFNTLESIKMKAFLKGEDEIASMIKTLANMFKVVLGKNGEENLFRNEVEYAIDYVSLQNNRFDSKFSLRVDLDEEILNSPIMVFVLQPIIENSINHGFCGYDTDLDINVNGHITKEQNIIIEIRDNGKGMNAEEVERINNYLSDDQYLSISNDASQSIGLKNIAERIRLNFGEEYYLRIRPENSVGTTVEFMVPKQ